MMHSHYRDLYLRKFRLLILALNFIFSTLLFSCRKQDKIETISSSAAGNNFNDIFSSFWEGMNRNYVMWGIDTTNWNNMYRKFYPKFSKLDIDKAADRLLAAGYIRQMTGGLRDAHFSLKFLDPLLGDSIIVPADDRLKQRPDYHKPFAVGYFNDLAKHYLDSPYYEADYNTDASHQLRYRAGTIQKCIYYLRLNSFSIYRAYHGNSKNMRVLLDDVFNQIKKSNGLGIILDLRDNTGGDLQDLNFFVGRFIDKPLQYGSSRYKSNNNPLDYTPWMPAIITPISGTKPYSKKIVILVNMHSISMAELTAMALKALPNTTLIGERTFGANGLLTQGIDLNSGSFKIENFATITAASALFRYKDNVIYEGIGFPPDLAIPYGVPSKNKDPQLENAIDYLLR